MYIKRKTYSISYDKNGNERIFSTNKISKNSENDEVEKEIKSNYTKGLYHSAGAGINVAVGSSLAKDAMKKKSKLALAGTALAAANAGYHSYKAGKNFKEGLKKSKNKKS